MRERVVTGEPFIPSLLAFCGPYVVLAVLAYISRHQTKRAFAAARVVMRQLRQEWRTRHDAAPLAPPSTRPALERLAIIPQANRTSPPLDPSRRLDQAVQALTPRSGAS